MSAVNLLTPILSGGIQNINFVNGRVLTAEDMTAERTATLQRQRLMGNCVGDGVASGFEVTLSGSSVAYGQQVVHITAGVAVNRNGDVMQLTSDTDVTLTATLPSVTVNGLFAPCAPPQTLLTNPGVYVLTVLPASGYQGQAPVTQLNSAGVATSCSSRYKISGVQFRLSLVTLSSTGAGLQPTLYALANQIQAQLNTGTTTAATLAPQLSQLQNGLAHACFGTDTLATYAANPFAGLPGDSSFDTYGLIDAQRTAGLVTDCEVPLALAYWSQQGIQFVDMWSVRRPVTPAASGDMSRIPGQLPDLTARRRSDALAVYLQFEAQMSNLVASLSSASLASATAGDYFLYLPPAGIVAQTGLGASGVTPGQLFAGRVTRGPFFIEGARLESLLEDSLRYAPIDLNHDQQMIWLYMIRENLQAASSGIANAPAPALLFTSGYVPYQAEPQFNLSHWNFANFAFVPVPAP
jgi:hypothetical protein